MCTECPSQPGRQCLATFAPSPFRPLVELLFSDKKPGELIARQCIIEIIAGLFDVAAENTLQPISHDDWRKPWGSRDKFGAAVSDSIIQSSSSQSRPQTGQNDVSPQLPTLQFDRRAGKGSEGSSTWESAGFAEEYSFVSGPNDLANTSKHKLANSTLGIEQSSFATYLVVKSLIIGPPNEKEEAQVYFMKSTRKTRAFKLWMDEIIGVLSDYFW